MITEEILLQNGFKKYDIDTDTLCLYRNANKFYQKKITDNKFLNVYYYGSETYEFEISEEREKCCVKKLLYAIDGNMSLEDVMEELNK